MVLYKRKKVSFVRPPDVPANLQTQVYVIPATKEWFLTYDEYLARMDYYKTPKFVCEITGNSCLTYFEALKSEEKEIIDVEKNCPESLREHILRFLQFNRITRLDLLVDKVYLVFKNDYFPGETIFIKNLNDFVNGTVVGADTLLPLVADEEHRPQTVKQRGTIREKVQYGSSGIVTTKYLVVTLNDFKQLILTPERIARDRNHFNKWLIKTFIKLTMSRSTKVGAPWVVKEQFAKKYRIPQDYPEDLKHFASTTPNGEIKFISTRKRAFPKAEEGAPNAEEGKKAVVKKKRKEETKKIKLDPIVYLDSGINLPIAQILEPIRKEFPTHHFPEPVKQGFERNPYSLNEVTLQPSKSAIVEDLEIRFDIQNPKPTPSALVLPENSKTWNERLVSDFKDELKDADEIDIPSILSDIRRLSSDKLMNVQDALQSWIFINIYHSVLKLDTFTFDDFIFCMGWNLDQYNELGRCELLDEIWCAVLGAIVSNEIPSKQQISQYKSNDEIFGLLVNLPDDVDSDNGSDTESDKPLRSDDEASDEESEEKPTNGSATETKVEEEAEVVEEESENESEDKSDEENEDEDVDEANNHNAYSVMNYRNIPWHERLRKRNFKDGNWQCILLGVLSLVEFVPAYKPHIEKVFQILAPKSILPSPTSVMNLFYEELDIDLKFRILGILVDLLSSGDLVRDYIDESLESSTSLRRNRLDNLKDFKSNLELAQKNNIILHDLARGAVKEEAVSVVRRPRLNFKAVEFTSEDERLSALHKEYQPAWNERKSAILKLEELKKQKKEIERKLIELDCQRVKLLGKDRLFNRYWWFENNGLPTFFGGNNNDEDEEEEKKEVDEDESDDEEVLDETYLMGRLWVQGPSEWDLQVQFGSSFVESEDFNKMRDEIQWQDKQENREGQTSVNGEIKEEVKHEIHLMDFKNLPTEFTAPALKLYNIHFGGNQINSNGQVIVDQRGSLTNIDFLRQLLPFQRKMIEERPDPLVNGTNWRYYDKPEEISQLIDWLNPWSKRESQLSKELKTVKDVILQSIDARRKALFLDKKPDGEIETEGQISKLEEKLSTLGNVVQESAGLETGDSDEDIVGGKRRGLRHATPSKKSTLNTFTEVFEKGDAKDVRPFIETLKVELVQKRKDRELQRVVEWVNSTALDELDKSLYDGGDKVKPKKKGRK